jgi:serine kinase of HPr protein (carbohydrate metabolism regulator)
MNLHATGVILGDRGVLISGPPNSGKSALALALIDRFAQRKLFARLISDDQVLISAHAGRLLCRAPGPIAGLIEVRGFGPAAAPYIKAAIVDLIVRLVPADEAPRLPDEAFERIVGCDVPRLDLPERHSLAAALAMEAWLAHVSRKCAAVSG